MLLMTKALLPGVSYSSLCCHLFPHSHPSPQQPRSGLLDSGFDPAMLLLKNLSGSLWPTELHTQNPPSPLANSTSLMEPFQDHPDVLCPLLRAP